MPFARENDISSDLTFDFLMILLESKSTVPKSAKFLEELYNKTLEYEAEKNGTEKTTYQESQSKHGLWSMEKLIKEFRKLFVDKTVFMTLYAESDSMPRNFTKGPEEVHPYKPTINQKSTKLDVYFDFFQDNINFN